MTIYLGIDPGLSGAVAALNSDTREIRFFDAPVMEVKVGGRFKNVPNMAEMVAILKLYQGQDVFAAIEKVQAMPGGGERTMGATSAFNFGMGFGIWLGILAALEIPYQQVHPATWKAKLMSGMAKEKDASRIRALELYPHISSQLSRKKDHGRAEALLLARYLWLTSPATATPQQGDLQALFA